MSADAPREFVDSNVLVYAFDRSAGAKCSASQILVERLWNSGAGCLSVQVLQEFFVAVTRKLRHSLSIDEAGERVREFTAWRVFAPKADNVLSAIELHKQVKVSFWDAMVVEAASQSGCELIWTEDLNHGQRIRGMQVRNPFLKA